MQNIFINSDDFDKYAEKQDKWILDNGWSLPEHNISMYRLKKFDKYADGKLVEYISMSRFEDSTNSINSVFHYKDKQSQKIWSGYVDSPDEYQVMMTVVNKFIEEYKNNSGAI